MKALEFIQGLLKTENEILSSYEKTDKYHAQNAEVCQIVEVEWALLELLQDFKKVQSRMNKIGNIK